MLSGDAREARQWRRRKGIPEEKQQDGAHTGELAEGFHYDNKRGSLDIDLQSWYIFGGALVLQESVGDDQVPRDQAAHRHRAG